VDDRLVGRVDVAWDGASHAFLLDTMVESQARQAGVGTALVQSAAGLAHQRILDVALAPSMLALELLRHRQIPVQLRDR